MITNGPLIFSNWDTYSFFRQNELKRTLHQSAGKKSVHFLLIISEIEIQAHL